MKELKLLAFAALLFGTTLGIEAQRRGPAPNQTGQCYNVHEAAYGTDDSGNWWMVMVGYCPSYGGWTSWVITGTDY